MHTTNPKDEETPSVQLCWLLLLKTLCAWLGKIQHNRNQSFPSSMAGQEKSDIISAVILRVLMVFHQHVRTMPTGIWSWTLRKRWGQPPKVSSCTTVSIPPHGKALGGPNRPLCQKNSLEAAVQGSNELQPRYLKVCVRGCFHKVIHFHLHISSLKFACSFISDHVRCSGAKHGAIAVSGHFSAGRPARR